MATKIEDRMIRLLHIPKTTNNTNMKYTRGKIWTKIIFAHVQYNTIGGSDGVVVVYVIVIREAEH